MTPEENHRRLGQALWDANAELATLRAEVERLRGVVDRCGQTIDRARMERAEAEDAETAATERAEAAEAKVAAASRWANRFAEFLETDCDPQDAVCHGFDITDDGRCSLAADLDHLRAIIRGDGP